MTTSEDNSTKTVELQIMYFLIEELKITSDEVSKMTLSERMSTIERRDVSKWNEFRKGLRQSGYII
jgi:hypothetical protein